MNCERCDEQAVIMTPALCSDHYVEWFERTVQETIEKHAMIPPGATCAVACSGGKDSTTILHILKTKGYEPHAIAIDEGIPGYRDTTLEDLKTFCARHHIPLKIHTFEHAYGFTLQGTLPRIEGSPCKTCGILRRHMLNTHSAGYSLIATGHNLDDEFQTIMMNLLKSNLSVLKRIGPISGSKERDGFVKRIKPLYYLTEKQVLVYTLIKGFGVHYTECPNARLGYRTRVRDLFMRLEKHLPGLRENTIRTFLNMDLTEDSSPHMCVRCGMPSTGDTCAACSISERLKT